MARDFPTCGYPTYNFLVRDLVDVPDEFDLLGSLGDLNDNGGTGHYCACIRTPKMKHMLPLRQLPLNQFKAEGVPAIPNARDR